MLATRVAPATSTMNLRPRKKARLYSQVPYPDGDPQGALQVLVADLDKEVFTMRELLGTDDKLVHGLMCSKKNMSPEQCLTGMTFMDSSLVERIGGYLVSRVHHRIFVPSPPYEDYETKVELAWNEIRKETGNYFQEKEKRAFQHLITRYTLLNHEMSKVKVRKVKFGGSFQFGIAARTDISKNEYIYECHGVTTRDPVNSKVNRMAVVMRTSKSSKGRTSYNVVMAGPGRLLNHHCNPNAMLVPIEDNTSAFSLQAIADIKEGEDVCIDYGDEYWSEEKPCLCSAHGASASSLEPTPEPISQSADEGEGEVQVQAEGEPEKVKKRRRGKPRMRKGRGGQHMLKQKMVDQWKAVHAPSG